MRFIGNIFEKLQRHPKRVVFPEGAEPRVLQAARQFYSLRLGAPILLGDRTKIKEAAEQLNLSIQGIRIINPADSEELPAHRAREAGVACVPPPDRNDRVDPVVPQQCNNRLALAKVIGHEVVAV